MLRRTNFLRQQKDGFNYIIRHHRVIQDLFKKYSDAAENNMEKKLTVDKIVKELSLHAGIEEQIVYPLVRNRLPGKDPDAVAEELIADHQTAKNLLYDLENMTPEDSEYDVKVHHLINDINEHIGREENEVFPKLRQIMTGDQLENLEIALDTAIKTAPTHPHPMAPNRPPGNLLNSVVGMADRVVDKITGRKA